MSIRLCNLLDREKYFLSELAYVKPPEGAAFSVSQAAPQTLCEYLRGIEALAASGRFPDMQTKPYRKRLARLRETLDGSANLRGALLIGYINDNFGKRGNTSYRWKTSLVAMAFRDEEGNGLVCISGCEMESLSSAVLDWGGCGLAFVGIVTRHHKRALRFYDEQMRNLPGERGVIGHSKGGNIATYIFIRRLSENVNAYCINAQPYCWFAMTRAQKAALKSDRYEFISHSKDFAEKFGYVSYISRVAPLSRYVKEGGLTSHEFSAVRFDEFGNLEGDRVIRETKGRIKSIVFGDDIAEKRLDHGEILALFQEQMKEIAQVPRLLSVGLEEIMLVMDAQAATLWMMDEDENGAYIYPYIVKGPASEALYRLKLRKGGGIAARSAFDGEPLLTDEAASSPDFMPGVDRSTGFQTRAMITVPLRARDVALGAMQILNKGDGKPFNQQDLGLAASMAECISTAFSMKGGSAAGVREFRLLRIYGAGGAERFGVEQNECRVLRARSLEEARACRDMLLGAALAQEDWLVFNRRVFDASMTEELERMRQRDISLIVPSEGDDACALLERAMQKRPMLVIAELPEGYAQSKQGIAFIDALRRLCDERTTTAVVISPSE